MGQPFDVIVIGVGSMGASACYHLAKCGVRVLGLEQFAVPHDQGSGHGFSRMIRLAYHEHPDYVPLLLRAYELWDEVQRRASRSCSMSPADCTPAKPRASGWPEPGRPPSVFVCPMSSSITRKSAGDSRSSNCRTILPPSTNPAPVSSSRSWRLPLTCGWH